MKKESMRKLLDVASGRALADLVIENSKIVDVFNAIVTTGDIAITDGIIAGIGSYKGIDTIDADGRFALPGFIDSHIHIESSFVSPEELGQLIVPHGTTTIIADPHEITNVAGIKGLEYMLLAAEKTALDIKYMLPSCVPATPFEHAGADLGAESLKEPLDNPQILGLGEFMNYVGVVNADDSVLNKLLIAHEAGKLIDGHSPGLTANLLNAYAAAGIRTDHECTTITEMNERLAKGMYVLLRQGSACHDLLPLLKGITPGNSRRCLLCSDDLQPKTISELGHIDHDLRLCVREGLDPITAIQMATLNAAECFRLHDRGAIAPGLRADIVLVDNLTDFNVSEVLLAGKKAAKKGQYLPAMIRTDITHLKNSFHVKDFSSKKLTLKLSSPHVHVIDVQSGGVVTGKGHAHVNRDTKGNFIYDPTLPIAKIAVIERHQNTGNTAVGLIRGYGIQHGAIALSIAHDSHNIITVGVNDQDMALAVHELLEQKGGIILVKNGQVLSSMPLPIGGIMSDQSGAWVTEKLADIHHAAHHELGVHENIEPVMTLGFMSLPVIPELKITDMGLFDVTEFLFIPVEISQNSN